MPTAVHYALVVLIWGSTFLAITYQLGDIDPLVSVVYRYALATVLLFSWCRMRGLSLAIPLRHHPYLVLLGALLFGFNYWFVYLAELYITSGLVAVIFSTMIFFNILFNWLFLKNKSNPVVIWGGVIGCLGIALLFAPEIEQFSWAGAPTIGLGLTIAATICASLGSITAARNTKYKLPNIQSNAWGMLYGTLLMLTIALVLDKPFEMDWSVSYVTSMLYLAIAGTIIAFISYTELIRRIGPARSAYATLMFPVVAMVLSSFFEGYQWTLAAFIGIGLIMLGNFFVLRKK